MNRRWLVVVEAAARLLHLLRLCKWLEDYPWLGLGLTARMSRRVRAAPIRMEEESYYTMQ